MKFSNKLIKLALLLKKAVDSNPWVELTREEVLEELFGDTEEKVKEFMQSGLKRNFLFDHLKVLPENMGLSDQEIWAKVEEIKNPEEIFRSYYNGIPEPALQKLYSQRYPDKLLILKD